MVQIAEAVPEHQAGSIGPHVACSLLLLFSSAHRNDHELRTVSCWEGSVV